MIVSETVLRSRIRSLLLEAQVYPLKSTLEDIKFYRDFEEGEFEQIEQRLRSNWDRGYSKYSQVIKKDVINSEEPVDHILDAIDSFMPYYSKVGPQMQAEIGRGGLTSSNLRGYVEGQASDKLNKTRTSQREACRRQVSIREGEECGDFKVIHADSNWIVIYPKTMLGSMSWAVGLADGSEEQYSVDSENRQVGRVEWCTAAYTNNRFPSYAGNMHMYYFVKNSGYDISDRYRRLCVTWLKDGHTGKVQIQHKGNATVDANNKDLSEKKMLSLIGHEIVEKMRVDALSRKATSLSEVASKVTLPMLKQDIENLKDDPGLLKQQLEIYAQHAKDPEVLIYLAELKNHYDFDFDFDFFHTIIIRSRNTKEGVIPEEMIRKYKNHRHDSYRYTLASDNNCPVDLYEFFASDYSDDVRSAIASKKDLPEHIRKMFLENKQGMLLSYCKEDISEEELENLFSEDKHTIRKVARFSPHRGFEFITRLLDTRDKKIILNVIKNKKLKINDKILKRLLSFENDDIRIQCVKRWVVSEAYLKDLISSSNAGDRLVAAHSSQLEEKDLIKLSKDESSKVRSAIASRSNLPEEVIRSLSKDESNIVRENILDHKVPDDVLRDLLDDKHPVILLKTMKKLSYKKIPKFKFFKIFSKGSSSFQLDILFDDREGNRTGKAHIIFCIAYINYNFSTAQQIFASELKHKFMRNIAGIVLHRKFSRKLLDSFNLSPKEIVQILRLSAEDIGYTAEELLNDEHIKSIFTEDELSTNIVDESKLLRSYINMLLD